MRSVTPPGSTFMRAFQPRQSSSAWNKCIDSCSHQRPRDASMTRPLSVAVVARAVMPLHGVGGLERSVHDLVRHLAARGVNVTLIVPPAVHVHRPTTADPFASQNISIRHVGYLSFPLANRRGTTVLDRSTSYLLYGWRAGRLARRLANEGAVDVVHGFGASVLGASNGMVAPLVLNPQGLEEF